MKKLFANIIALVSSLTGIIPFTHAANLDAHVHGLSGLTIAMEGKTLEIQFTSPAFNLLGFEHKANTKEDIAAIKALESRLRQHETLFLFSEGRCNHVKTFINLTSLINKNDDEHTHQEKRITNEYEHEHEDHVQENNHSEAAAHYHYHCENNAQPSSIRVAFFKPFPGIHIIQAMWVKQTRQGAKTLTPDNSIIMFR